ncbi:MAG: MBL fold metallo-hydrolase [Acidobacteria bacterium]|nr:MBL fold metallo-hydrolase [Acidobacteriota bacterium]
MNVLRLHANNPSSYTGAGNNTYLLPGRVPVLIDAGTGDARHLAAVAGALGEASLRAVIATHAHPDHVGGARAMAARWPDAVFAKKPWPERDATSGVEWTPIADGDRIPAGDSVLVAIHTPGHAPDHLVFFDEDSRTLIGGDLLVAGGTVVIPASHGGSLRDYLASLRRVLSLAPTRVLPAHGPDIEDPARLIHAYLAHREQRDVQILEALAAGRSSVEAIVRRVYEGLDSALEGAAAETVLAHLQKLEQERRVRRVGEAWIPTD